MVRVPLVFLAAAALAAAQSHPSWWTYASPEATALVGIDLETVRATPFAEPIEAELWGDLGFLTFRASMRHDRFLFRRQTCLLSRAEIFPPLRFAIKRLRKVSNR